VKTLMPVILVAVGGAVGAVARFGLSGFVQGNRVGFPFGTLVVNLIGCLAMGFLARWVEVGIASPQLRLLLGLGFLGGFTTFSSFSFEALNLYLNHNVIGSLLYVAASMVGCLALVTFGYMIARYIWG